MDKIPSGKKKRNKLELNCTTFCKTPDTFWAISLHRIIWFSPNLFHWIMSVCLPVWWHAPFNFLSKNKLNCLIQFEHFWAEKYGHGDCTGTVVTSHTTKGELEQKYGQLQIIITSTILEQELRSYVWRERRGYLSKDAFSYLTYFFCWLWKSTP